MVEKQLIMVVGRESLFGESNKHYFQGFKQHKEVDYEKIILENFGWMQRRLVEDNPNFKQPIAYTLIVNPSLKKVFAYQRAEEDKHYGEKRLQGKWSLGVGGHIEMKDILGKSENPIKASLERELGKEEVEFVDGEIFNLDVFGYINNDLDDVGKVHFGILYLAETGATVVKPRDPEIRHGELLSLSELEKIRVSQECKVEGWSEIAFEPLEAYLRG